MFLVVEEGVWRDVEEVNVGVVRGFYESILEKNIYYNSEQHSNAIYLPKFDRNKPLYLGFFNTGAYQETIGGFGGLKHCLIPEPKHILIQRDQDGKLYTQLFSEEQTAADYLRILGY